MSGRMKPARWKIVLYGVVVGSLLMLTACADFKKDFLCRPDGHCVNASPGHTGIGI
jgi:hypothetical protein